LFRFLEQRPVGRVSQFQSTHATEFVRYLRDIQVSPNGHANSPKRQLMDKGLRYVLECCRALFNYAAKHRHLSPYAENPFQLLDIKRIPVENSRLVTLFTAEQERAFLEACDAWQLPMFLTLMLTGIRPGELTHLLLPEDLDLGVGILRVRNKPRLGWQVKTRNERDIPLVTILKEVLLQHLGQRRTGPVFLRRMLRTSPNIQNRESLEKDLARRVGEQEQLIGHPVTRTQRDLWARRLWRHIGVVKEEYIRIEFMRLTRRIGLPLCTAQSHR
jgi:integrase